MTNKRLGGANNHKKAGRKQKGRENKDRVKSFLTLIPPGLNNQFTAEDKCFKRFHRASRWPPTVSGIQRHPGLSGTIPARRSRQSSARSEVRCPPGGSSAAWSERRPPGPGTEAGRWARWTPSATDCSDGTARCEPHLQEERHLGQCKHEVRQDYNFTLTHPASQVWWVVPVTLHYMTCHLLDAFIQSDLHTQYCGQSPQEQFGVKCLRVTTTCWLQWGLNLWPPDPNT